MYFAVMQLCPQRLLGHLSLSKWPQFALACEILGLHFVFLSAGTFCFIIFSALQSPIIKPVGFCLKEASPGAEGHSCE